MKIPRAAQYIKHCREKCGLSQRDISSALGYSTPQMISNVERGTAPVPEEWIELVPEILGCDSNVLIRYMVRDYHERLKLRLV